MLSRHARLLVPGVVTGWMVMAALLGEPTLQVHTVPSLSSPCIETPLSCTRAILMIVLLFLCKRLFLFLKKERKLLTLELQMF
jgi:hypothetical protein